MAGPPFTTDDPEPVEYRHWESYLASQHAKTSGDWSGTAPHVEVNYGVIPDVMVHVITPFVYDAPSQGAHHYGYGDTELGVKVRFIQETQSAPQVGVFPQLEIPTGDADRGLGTGRLQTFLPLWAQKSFGPWTMYGGGGYGINPGRGSRDWTFLGLVTQCQVRKDVMIGTEFFHHTATQEGGRADTAFNLGTVIDFGDQYHLLFSAGRSIDGPTEFQAYVAFQITFGPGPSSSEVAGPRQSGGSGR
jgi:hypothetical protein